MKTETLSIQQKTFLEAFNNAFLDDRTLTSNLKNLSICCGFRNILRESAVAECVNHGIRGVLKKPTHEISEGEFLGVLILLGITLFTTKGSQNIPGNAVSRLTEIFTHLQSTSGFNCAELLFYTAIEHTMSGE